MLYDTDLINRRTAWRLLCADYMMQTEFTSMRKNINIKSVISISWKVAGHPELLPLSEFYRGASHVAKP